MRGMWKHLERLGGGVGTRGPGESQLETDRRLARRRITLLRRRLRELRAQRATRRKERSARRDADGGARRLHERRQVDAAQRAHRAPRSRSRTGSSRRSIRRRAASSTTASATSSPTRSGSSGDCRRSSSKGFASTLEETLVADLVLHVVDASLPEDGLRRADRGGRTRCSPTSAPTTSRSSSSSTRSTSSIRWRAGGSRTASPDAIAGLGGDGRGARRAAGAASRRALPTASTTCGCSSRTTRAHVLSELYALGAPIDERHDTEAGVVVRARLPHREIAAVRAVPRRRRRPGEPRRRA